MRSVALAPMLLVLAAVPTIAAQEPLASTVEHTTASPARMSPLPQRTADGRRFAEVVQRCAGLIGPKVARANECMRAGAAMQEMQHPAAGVLFAQACLEGSELGCEVSEQSASTPVAPNGWRVRRSLDMCAAGDDIACGRPMFGLASFDSRRGAWSPHGEGSLRGIVCDGETIFAQVDCARRSAQLDFNDMREGDRRTRGFSLGAPSLEGPSQGQIKAPARQQ